MHRGCDAHIKIFLAPQNTCHVMHFDRIRGTLQSLVQAIMLVTYTHNERKYVQPLTMIVLKHWKLKEKENIVSTEEQMEEFEEKICMRLKELYAVKKK